MKEVLIAKLMSNSKFRDAMLLYKPTPIRGAACRNILLSQQILYIIQA